MANPTALNALVPSAGLTTKQQKNAQE